MAHLENLPLKVLIIIVVYSGCVPWDVAIVWSYEKNPIKTKILQCCSWNSQSCNQAVWRCNCKWHFVQQKSNIHADLMALTFGLYQYEYLVVYFKLYKTANSLKTVSIITSLATTVQFIPSFETCRVTLKFDILAKRW